MAGPLSPLPITLGGIPLEILPDPNRPDQDQTAGYSGEFVSQDASKALTRDDVPIQMRRFDRFGVIRRRDEDDDGGYAWLESGISWLGNGIRPAGRRQRNSVNSIANTGRIFGSVEFASDMWMAATVRSVLRFANADPSATPTAEPTGVTGLAFNGGTPGFRSGYHPKAICLFTDDAGVPGIYVSTYNSGTGATRLYEWQAVAGWSESGVMGFRLDLLKSVYWTSTDGTGAQRLAGQTGDSSVRHCIQGSDPLDPTKWVTPIEATAASGDVGNLAFTIKNFAATPQHLWTVKSNGIHDFNALRASNLTPYWEERAAINNGDAVAILDDYLYASRDFGLDRLYIGAEGAQQRRPGECSPSYKTQDGHPIRGYITALTVHEGSLLAAVYNPDSGVSYVMRGFPKQGYRMGHENPLEWHGAEVVITGGLQITHMRVGSPNVSVSSTLPARTTVLWCCIVAATSPINIGFDYIPLPSSGGPVSLVVSGGSFESEPTARYFLTAQDWDDDNADKYVRRSDMRNQLASATRTHKLYSREFGDPTTLANTGTYTLEGTATANSAKILPSPPTSGKTLMYMVEATTPSPYTTAPIFQSLSPRAAVVRETYESNVLSILLMRNYETANGAPDIRSVDATAAAVAALPSTGFVTYLDPKDTSYTVLIHQRVTFETRQIEGAEWRTVMIIRISKVA